MSGMDADTKYEAIEAAFRALVQEANGRPLANLFRELLPKAGGGIVPVPLEVVAEIAELLDPRFPSSRFSKPPPDLPPDQVQIVNGEPRLKAMVKLDEAVKAANIERVRLAHIHNEEANKSRDKPEKWVRTLEAFAEERGDTKALAAFAKEREARAKSEAALAARRAVPVQLKVVEILQARNPHFERNSRIVGEMLLAIEAGKSVSEAAESIGDRQTPTLSERRVTEIWAAVKNPAGWKFPPKPRQRRHVAN
jgi:hypothetical protein